MEKGGEEPYSSRVPSSHSGPTGRVAALEMVLAFELGPSCAGPCMAGGWHVSCCDSSFPAQSFASAVPSASILPHTCHHAISLCLEFSSMWPPILL